MFGFTDRRCSAMALAGVCAAMTLSAKSQQELDSIRRSQILIEALFPDLKGERLRVQASFGVEFDQPWQAANLLQIIVESPGPAAVLNSSRTLLRAQMQFNRGEYESALFEGELCSERRPMECLAAIV